MSPPSSESREPLLRQLGGLAIWLLVVNGMIGAGIFGLPAEAARLTGVFSPWMFLLCGLLLAPVVLCFGEVSSLFRGTGGPILYAREAFGPLVGFQSGWALYVSRVTAFAANINLLVSTLGWFWGGADQGVTRVVLLAVICTALTWANYRGTRTAMGWVGVLTVAKFLPLLLLLGVGLAQVRPAAFAAEAGALPAAGGLGAAALLLIYAFVGFESALVPAGEARDPARSMPRALLWGLGVVTLLYVAVQAVCVAVLPDLAQSSRPVVDAGEALMGRNGGLVLMVGVIVSVGGNVAAAMLTAPRMTYALARERCLPASLGAVHARHHTPHRSVLLYGALCFLFAAWGSFGWLAGMTSVTRLLIYLTCIVAIPRLRRTRGDAPGRLRLPGGLLVPGLAVAVCLWLLAQVSSDAVLVTAVFLLIGGLLYGVAARRAS
ncbi:MAG: APC family permease [Planctomycetota bacterium]